MKNLKSSNKILAKASLLVAMLAFVLAPAISYADSFNVLLKVGVRNSEVTTLQTFLAGDSSLYPQGLVTGYFGSMTKAAVIRFQARNGLSADGVVGPMTRAALNAQIGGGLSNNGNAPVISNAYVNPSRNSASVVWNTNVPAQGVVYYSTTPLTTYEHENSVDVSGQTAMTNSSAQTSQNVSLSNLQAGTTYYYLIYTTGQDGAVSVTWPATFMTTN